MILDEVQISKMPPEEKILFYRRMGAKIGENVSIGDGSVLLGLNLSLGSESKLGSDCRIVCRQLVIGENVVVGDNVDIRGKSVLIGDNVEIGSNLRILAPEKFIIGCNSNFGSNNTITCRSFSAGEYTQFYDGITVGGGGKYGVNSRIAIGDHCYIGDKCVLNTSEAIDIGNDVGIGRECLLWTHGAWGPVMKGYPAVFEPISIGDNVWIPARTIILPGVKIGSDVVVGTNSLVNKNIPSGSFAAGSPIKIREGVYPKQLSESEKKEVVKCVLSKYRLIIKDKEIQAKVSYSSKREKILLLNGNDKTVFDLKTMRIAGSVNEASEDLRDFLRRNGIKFFTDQKFKSIIPPAFEEFLYYDKKFKVN